MCLSIKLSRREQSEREFERLIRELKAWGEKRRDADKTPDEQYRGQYESQLKAVVDEVEGAIGPIRATLRALQAEALDTSTFFAGCRRIDRQLVWLRNCWNHYREKFDQRDDPDLGPALRAAEEVVWSCYKPFFQGSKRPVESIPLPYIEPEYSPIAFERYKAASVLPGKDSELRAALEGYFGSLPLPLLQLPPAFVTSPWLLPLVGHEVGHFIYPQVQPSYAYLKVFQSLVITAAATAGGTHADQEAWAACAPELFADAYAVLTMGPWAYWAIDLLDRAEGPAMLVRRASYPSRLVRLHFMADLARRHGVSTATDLLAEILGASLGAVRNPLLDGDRAIAAAVAEAVFQHELPNGLGRLDSLLSFRPDDFAESGGAPAQGLVEQWSIALRSSAPLVPQQNLRAARLIAAATARARWLVMKEPDEPERNAAIRAMDGEDGRRVLTLIVECAEAGKRSDLVRPAERANPGAGLSSILLRASNEELGIEAVIEPDGAAGPE